MKIYNYGHASLQFLSVSEAEPDPMTPGEYIVPAFATSAPPPPLDGGEVAVFDLKRNRWAVQKVVAAAPAPAAAPVPFNVKVAAWRANSKTYLDMVAAAYDFDDMAEAVSYADEPAVPKFQMLGAALRAWRSTFWQGFDDMCAQIAAEKLAEPTTPEELGALLPAFEAPDVSRIGIEPYVAPVDEHDKPVEPA